MSLHVGDEVVVQVGHGHACRNIGAFVRFKGSTDFAAGTWLGLELSEAVRVFERLIHFLLSFSLTFLSHLP